MFAIYGIRILSLSTSVRLLRVCPSLTHKFPSSTFKEFNNFYSTSWPSSRITKPTRKIDSLCFINPPAYYSTKSPRPSRDDIQLNKKITSLKSVEELLELFESVKKSASIVNRVTLLYSMAKITERDEKHNLVLEEQQNNQDSTYMDLLDSISKDITKCRPRHLANVIWALGKLQEKDHKLVKVCEKEILSRDIVAINNANICQIVNGCANLSMTTTEIFTKLQEAILNGKSWLGRICVVICKKELKADKLFDRVEEEILKRGTTDLSKTDFIQILWAYGKAGKGSKQLFYSVDNELVSRGVEKFHNGELFRNCVVFC
ncbi:hypothetical protein OS493_031376 [Desmophyllum pertusum]|uniref:Uncharacterized protein n=1 Tax=Desmophyllum pertusum TaxID=174260 RepID=A0A9X0CEC3_9CNID|nr:hypothetical protein OS493_031376 [Desmophyllum pertusum]